MLPSLSSLQSYHGNFCYHLAIHEFNQPGQIKRMNIHYLNKRQILPKLPNLYYCSVTTFYPFLHFVNKLDKLDHFKVILQEIEIYFAAQESWSLYYCKETQFHLGQAEGQW